MVKLESVIFDMDGLMFDTERLYFESNRHVLEEMGYPYSLDDYKKVVGKSGQEFIAGMLDILPDLDAYQHFIQEADAYFLKLVHEENLPVKAGLYDLIDYLREKGIQKSLVSSSNRSVIELFLQRSGLKNDFQHVVAGDEVSQVKPHPEPYLTAWKRTGVDKGKTWVLEDSLSGVRSAKAAGLSVALIPDLQDLTDQEKAEADCVFANLHQVKVFFQVK